MAYTGTYTISDLLASDAANQTIQEFGEETLAEIVQEDLRLLNERVNEQMSRYVQIVTRKEDRHARYGTSVDDQMTEVDEFGKVPTSKQQPGQTVGFPLRKYGFAVGWTRDYMLQATVQDLIVALTASQRAYVNRLQRELQRAIYLSTNYTYADRFVDKIDLAVKRLVNADGASIPNGPNGETFSGATHTHYTANSGWDNTALGSAVSDLTEHGHTSGVQMIINIANQAAVEALSDFTAYADPRLTYRATDTTTRTLDLNNIGNRAIGIFKEAEVWVKPWALASYALITAVDDPEKPLKMRQHNVSSVRGLRIAAQNETYPIRADEFEAYLGFGVWSRTNGVVHYAGSGTYADPTIAS